MFLRETTYNMWREISLGQMRDFLIVALPNFEQYFLVLNSFLNKSNFE